LWGGGGTVYGIVERRSENRQEFEKKFPVKMLARTTPPQKVGEIWGKASLSTEEGTPQQTSLERENTRLRGTAAEH